MIRRRRRLRSPQGAELQLRELREALQATGREAAPGATLLAIQDRLSHAVGPDAARYAAALRESRYGRRRRARPGPGRAQLVPLGAGPPLGPAGLVEGAPGDPARRPQGLSQTPA